METINITGTVLFAIFALTCCAILIYREYLLLKARKSLETAALKRLEKIYMCQLGLAAGALLSFFEFAEWTNFFIVLECFVSMFAYVQYCRAKNAGKTQSAIHQTTPRGFTVVFLLILSILCAAFRFDAQNGTMIFGYLALLLAVAGMSVVAIGIASGFWTQNRPFAISCIVVALVASCAMFGLADPLVLRIRFALTRPYYEYRLQTLLQTKASERGFLWFARYESGPPERVAFCIVNYGHGSWIGQVYDPSGLVMLSNEMNPENRYEDRFYPVRELFGGTLIAALPVGANWYVCSFF